MCCILKDKGKKKKRKKADFWGGHMFPIFKMWLIFLWNDLNRKKKCGNLKEKKKKKRVREGRRAEDTRRRSETKSSDEGGG